MLIKKTQIAKQGTIGICSSFPTIKFIPNFSIKKIKIKIKRFMTNLRSTSHTKITFFLEFLGIHLWVEVPNKK